MNFLTEKGIVTELWSKNYKFITILIHFFGPSSDFDFIYLIMIGDLDLQDLVVKNKRWNIFILVTVGLFSRPLPSASDHNLLTWIH